MTRVKFVHTNLIASDWRRLVRFYQDVFGCVPVPPERDLGGAEMDAGTGIRNAHVRGMHLRLPGSDADGPTLEIFEYGERGPDTPRAVNQPGFAHIAFSVGSVHDARASVLSHGGSPVGEVVTTTISPTARITWCYVRDPEGNIVELQSRVEEPRTKDKGSVVVS